MQSLGMADSEGIHKLCGSGENQRQAKIKRLLWGGQFWADGYYVATAGERGDRGVVEWYVKNQGELREELRQIKLS